MGIPGRLKTICEMQRRLLYTAFFVTDAARLRPPARTSAFADGLYPTYVERLIIWDSLILPLRYAALRLEFL